MSIRRTGGPSHPINVDHIEAPVHAFDTISWEGTGAAAKAAPGCSPLRATAALRHPPSSANDRRPVSHHARILRSPPIPSVKHYRPSLLWPRRRRRGAPRRERRCRTVSARAGDRGRPPHGKPSERDFFFARLPLCASNMYEKPHSMPKPTARIATAYKAIR